MLFSSGSTGPRKAIRLGEAQLLHVARAVAQAYELGPADRGFNSLPLTHVNGEVVGLLAPLVSGGTVVLDDRFRRTNFWDVVAQRGATWVNAVPSIITILAQEPPGPTAPSAPCRRSGSSARPRRRCRRRCSPVRAAPWRAGHRVLRHDRGGQPDHRQPPPTVGPARSGYRSTSSCGSSATARRRCRPVMSAGSRSGVPA